jgi:hypothetical protein
MSDNDTTITVIIVAFFAAVLIVAAWQTLRYSRAHKQTPPTSAALPRKHSWDWDADEDLD